MNKSILFTATGLVIASLALATTSNAQSPMNDQAYCRALVDAYTQGGGARGSLQPDNATAVAIAQCREGNAGPSIPVLEQALRDARITLPRRS